MMDIECLGDEKIQIRSQESSPTMSPIDEKIDSTPLASQQCQCYYDSSVLQLNQCFRCKTLAQQFEDNLFKRGVQSDMGGMRVVKQKVEGKTIQGPSVPIRAIEQQAIDNFYKMTTGAQAYLRSKFKHCHSGVLAPHAKIDIVQEEKRKLLPKRKRQ